MLLVAFEEKGQEGRLIEVSTTAGCSKALEGINPKRASSLYKV
jgi:hypothetical protein